MADTKDSILNASERLFAERGFDAVSLRAITTAAGVNLAAVNYHFHSKKQLLQALFTRGVQKLNRKRIALLDAYEAEHGKGPVPVEKLVRAIIEPMFDITGSLSKDSKTFSMLLGRMYSTPEVRLDPAMLSDIENFGKRFEPALRRALPGVVPEDLYWRSFFAIGATAHTLASSQLLQNLSYGLCNPDDRETTLKKLTAFIVAGLKAGSGIKQKKAGKTGTNRRGK
ncbi:MAG: TetR family transcriptional regulator [Acidobacteria bacterium]|nr:TetR family transcriptional regulator [Acidobacteriota bacterium]